MVLLDCVAYLSAYESRTSCTRTRCCTTRGGRRSFFRDVNSESACIDGVDTLAHVIKVLSASGFGILDSCIHVCVQVSIQVYIDQSRKEVRPGMSRDGSSPTNEQRRELAHE